MPADSHIDTYYRRTAVADPGFGRLAGRHEVDVCVVGGGLAGLSTALELVQRGLRVALLERHRIAWGASGRNGGFVTAGYATGLDRIARRLGMGAARELHALSVEGVAIVREAIDRYAIPGVHPTAGVLRAIRYDDAAGLQAERDRMERDYGVRLEYRSRPEIQFALSSPAYYQGLYDPDAFHFHPLNYALGLAREIARRGGLIFEGSPAQSCRRRGDRFAVAGAEGEILAAHLVLAGGGYTDRLVPALHRAYLPIATYVLLTEPIPHLEHAIRTSAAVADDRRAGDYYRVVDRNRLLWGGCITTRTRDPADLAMVLRRRIIATYPQLEDVRVAAAWSGLMSYARHLMPQIGCLSGDRSSAIWYLTGFGGHGMNTTAIGGRLVAEAIVGESDRIEAFRPFGLSWNGGPVGRAAVQLTYWALQAMDAWRERKSRGSEEA